MSQTRTTEHDRTRRRSQFNAPAPQANLPATGTESAAPGLDLARAQRLADPSGTLLPGDVQQWAGTLGNQAVQGLLAQRAPGPAPSAAPQIQRSPLRPGRLARPLIQRGPLDWYRRRKINKRGRNKLTDANVQSTSGKVGTKSVNDVFKVNTKGGIGSSATTEGFFKPNDDDFTSEDGFTMSNRAIASTVLNEYLGFNNIAKNVYANIGNQQGSVAARVPGMPLMEAITDNNGDSTGGLRYGAPDFTNPVTQKGLMDLQLFDLIKGEGDRHGGNIYIDPQTGQVSGIDEDLSFGDTMGVFKREKKVAPGYSDPDAKYSGMPLLFDEKTANRLLSKKAKHLPKLLQGHISDDEIKQTQDRLRYVKAHLREQKKQGRLVKQWDKSTYDQTMSDKGQTGLFNRTYFRSYLKRQQDYRQNASQDDEVLSELGPGGVPWEDNQLFG